MGDTSSDPIDHARTTRQHAGETMKNGVNAPGLLLLAPGVVAAVCAMAGFATGHADVGTVLGGVMALLWVVGGAWVYLTHRRVRRQELEWHARHGQGEPEPPTS